MPFHTGLHDTVTELLDRAVANHETRPLDVTCPANAILAALVLAIDLYLCQRQVQGLAPAPDRPCATSTSTASGQRQHRATLARRG